MNNAIRSILSAVEKEGFEAYVVGGYVRDNYIGNTSSDIDIITNALPKDLVSIFDGGIVSKELYGSFKIRSDKNNFDITTYRKEAKYKERRPTKVEYINNLILDLNRRDFTMNSLVMNKDGNVIDFLNGKKDIDEKLVKVIGSARSKIKEDPLRILRAIRFATVLDFNLDEELLKAIKKFGKLVKSLSYERKKEELDKILSSTNALKGLGLLKECKLLEHLEINYDKVILVNDLSGMYCQIEVSSKYNFTKQEKENIKTIKTILKYGTITNEVLYRYGLYYSGVAGSIMGLSNKEINKVYQNLPIKNIKDIDITSNEIIRKLNIKPSIIIKEIYNDLENNILNNNLKNKKEELISYIIGKW